MALLAQFVHKYVQQYVHKYVHKYGHKYGHKYVHKIVHKYVQNMFTNISTNMFTNMFTTMFTNVKVSALKANASLTELGNIWVFNHFKEIKLSFLDIIIWNVNSLQYWKSKSCLQLTLFWPILHNHLQVTVSLDKVDQVKLCISSWLDQDIQFYPLDLPSAGLVKYFNACTGGGWVR